MAWVERYRDQRIECMSRDEMAALQSERLVKQVKNVYENVAFAMNIVKATPKHIRRQVPMVLALVGLSNKSKCYPNELSGGEQQRVAVARAIVNNCFCPFEILTPPSDNILNIPT